MADGILNFHMPGRVTPKAIADEAAAMAEAYAASPVHGGSASKKIGAFLVAIASKCSLCCADEKGRAEIRHIAECPKACCPLNAIGPSVFQNILVKLEEGP
jgi:hypothetical protein